MIVAEMAGMNSVCCFTLVVTSDVHKHFYFQLSVNAVCRVRLPVTAPLLTIRPYQASSEVAPCDSRQVAATPRVIILDKEQTRLSLSLNKKQIVKVMLQIRILKFGFCFKSQT